MFILYLMAAMSLAPTPQPRIEWKTYPTSGFILCAPVDTTRVNRVTPCLTLPPGSYLVVPTLTTEPDPDAGKEKS